MLSSSVPSAARASPLRRQQVRRFRPGPPYHHFHPRLCRRTRRKHAPPKPDSAQDPHLPWPLASGFWALENTYQAIVKQVWSKSQWSASAVGFYNKHPSPQNESGKRQSHWIDLHFYSNNRGDATEHESRNPKAPEPKNQGNIDPSSYHSYIDPITNRRVSRGIGQDESQPGPKDADMARHGHDPVEHEHNSSEHRPDSGAHGHDAYTKEVPKISQSGSRQSFPSEDSSTIDNLGQKPVEQSPTEGDGTRGKVRLHFDDLKPSPAELDTVTADAIDRIIRDLKTRGSTSPHEVKPDTSGMTKGHSIGSRSGTCSGKSGMKPTGCVEESVAPERLRDFSYKIEQTTPGDFPQSTMDSLRKKYGNAEVKKYTAVRCQDQNEPSGTSAKAELHSQVTINEQGHEHSLSGISGPEVVEELRKRQMDERVGSPKHRAWLDSMEQLSRAIKQDEMRADAADREAALAMRRAKAKACKQHTPEKRLTGNYARDFPEEFEKSWGQTLSSIPTEPLCGTGQPEPARIQPALDRHHKVRHGLHAHFLPEHSRNVDSSAEPFYRRAGPGELSNEHPGEAAEGLGNSNENGSALSGTSTTLYKVLVYDSTAQTISIAETSSLVGDFTSALSPAAALSRLSHPTKFLPHFANLEAEGFEIVSGSGDVLVFRKARPSAVEQQEASRAAAEATTDTSSSGSEPSGPPINPIDMTGRPKFMTPASANFASPTGFVAYPESEAVDLPPPPRPRIKYDRDVRREEPVYSGPETRSYDGETGQERQRKKPGVGKRILVGGVWVAGISYGLGVVSEYFVTGGVDGTGPTGF